MNRSIAADDNDLCTCFFAHAVDRPRHAGSCGILVASGGLGHDGNGSVRTAADGSSRFKRRWSPSIDHEAYILARALPCHCCAGLHAEKRIALGARDAGSGGSPIGSPFHVDLTWRGSRSTRIARIAKLRRICL